MLAVRFVIRDLHFIVKMYLQFYINCVVYRIFIS